MGYSGAPSELIGMLRCPNDGAPFDTSQVSGRITDGSLRCSFCGREHPIRDGIVRMLDESTLSEEELREVAFRDRPGVSVERCLQWEESTRDIEQHISALQLRPTDTLLEIGAGKGRFTVRLAPKCKAIVAVDFAPDSLRFLAQRLSADANVLLVHADATKLRVKPRSFTRALSTTSLDSREQRIAVHRIVSEALTDDGRWVFGAERYTLRQRFYRQPRAMRYTAEDGDGSAFLRFLRHEIEREAHPYFASVSGRPIDIHLPLGRRLPFLQTPLASRLAERIPGLRQLGELWLVCARKPTRELGFS